MPVNKIKFPYLNPLKCQLINPALIPQYISKHMDDFAFNKTFFENEQDVSYRHDWLTVDPFRLQYESNFLPLNFKIFKCKDGAEVYDTNLTTHQQNAFDPTYFLRQLDFDLNILTPDFYYATLNGKYVYEPFRVNGENELVDSLLLEYEHHELRGGLRFGAPNSAFKPVLRVPARLKYNDTGSKDVIYEDDPLNEVLIDSRDFRVWDFILINVPPWLADKVKRIFGCSSLKIDGRYYTKNGDSAKWERIEVEDYPMQSWKIQLRERYNKEGLTFEDDVEIIGVAAAGLIMDTKGFGMEDNSGNDYLEIDSVL